MNKLTKESTEDKVKANLREYCKKHGAFITHIAATQFGQAGAPDYIVLNVHGRTIYIECKRPYGASQSATQKVYQEEIESRGGRYFLYNGLNDEALITLLEWYK